jgi:ketosteroid isomerase-like protein
MSLQNVELVRAVHPAGADLVEFFSADEAAVAAFKDYGPADSFAEDFEVRFISDSPDFNLAYRGVDGFVAGWRDWLEPWANYRMEVEDVLDAGDKVVSLVRVSGKTARDGVTMEHSPASVWTIRDGKIAQVHFYLNREQAFEAAGFPSRNAVLAARLVAAFNSGDVEAAVELMHPEVEFIPRRAPIQGTYRGHSGIRKFFADNEENFELFQVDPEENHDLGDGRVLGVGTLRVRGKGSGVEVAVQSAVILSFDEEKVIRFEDFGEREKAFEAAGLSEQNARQM